MSGDALAWVVNAYTLAFSGLLVLGRAPDSCCAGYPLRPPPPDPHYGGAEQR